MRSKISFLGKALFIESSNKKIIVIGDLHLGYEASLNAIGVFVSRTLMETMIKELNEVFQKSGRVNEIILLGDVKHTFGNILKEEWSEATKIISFLRKNCEKIIVIKGNHDILTEIIGKRIGFEVVDYYITEGNSFIHGDRNFKEIWSEEINRIIMGHLHPAVIITDGTKREKYKCFLEGKYNSKEIIILPSFISANEGTDPRDYKIELPWKLNLNNFEVCIVGEGLEVLKFGKLKNVKNIYS